MTEALPTQAEVVIVGGGIIGCSIAYHLTKVGRRDVVLLERGHLTGGTSWHAAGLVNQLRATSTLTELARYAVGLYGSLEAETGQATGFRRKGSLPIARTDERLTEIRRMAALGDCFGVEALRSRAERGEGALSADGCLADQGRDLHPRRWANQSRRYRDGARQGCARPAARESSRRRPSRASSAGTARSPVSAPRARHHRLRDRCQLRRHLGARDRADGGRQRAALCRRAHVRGHRPDRGALPRGADRPRHRRLHLCEGGCGPAPRRLLRARGQAAAAGQDAGRRRVRGIAGGLGPFRAAHDQRDRALAGARAGAHPPVHERT